MTPSELQEQLTQVTHRALSIDMRPFEGLEREVLQSELSPIVIAAVADGLNVLSSVLHHYESASPRDTLVQSDGQDKFYEGIDDLVASAPAAQRVADIAFMARWELQSKKQAMESSGVQGDSWSIIATCGSARRRLIKSTVAVELALCQFEGLESHLGDFHVTELRRSVETRRAYARFAKAVTNLQSGDLKTRLRRGGTAIATLIGRDIYADLRASDRKHLRTLQEEILTWLGGSDGFAEETGSRLCENLEVIANVLLQVNHRAELLEHDRKILNESYTSLFSSNPTAGTMPFDVTEKMEALFGRDPEIDELIENASSFDVEDWRKPLRRVLQALENLTDDSRESEQTADADERASATTRFA